MRLQPKDWTSGKVNWLLDVIAPNEAVTEGVVGNFLMMKKDEERQVHPSIARHMKPETLANLGLTPITVGDLTSGGP